MKRLTYLILTFALFSSSCTKIILGDNATDSSGWLSAVADDTPVASLSIPGSHDAASYTINTPFVEIFARTQAMTISEQLNYGVRAFDLRPAIADNRMKIFHDVYDTNVLFADAIDTILDFLGRNPSEFAIVLIRHEEEADNADSRWSGVLYDILSSLPENRVVRDFKPDLTVGQIRGKILFISRNPYENGPIGAFVSNWYSGKDIRLQKSAGINEGALWVQDYYDPNGKEDKLDAIRNMLNEFSGGAAPGTWCINHASGYTSGIFGAPDYRENAQNVNSLTAEWIEGLNGSAGIVMMDFAGASKCGKYPVCGDKLLRALINHNRLSTKIHFNTD